MLTLSAPAKINLVLEVLGRRPDGYHEVVTVLQEIDLTDVVSFGEHRQVVMDSPDALMLKAVRLLQTASGCSQGVSISVAKRIPVAAGLGGSSSRAAATLRGLNHLWELGMTQAELAALGSKVSADTPFFLYGGTALGEGRGDAVTRLPSFQHCWVVLFRPPVSVPASKTGSLYRLLDSAHFTDGRHASSVVARLRSGTPVDETALYNVFEKVGFAAFPGLEGFWHQFQEVGACPVHLAGSGPTLFTLVSERSHADRMHRSLQEKDLEVYVVET
ncbi:MAG: 4-(cytidine 5'-diphospho)-2-C-methyl-D-erythritol kinase, partial [Chloroflexota bacterium]